MSLASRLGVICTLTAGSVAACSLANDPGDPIPPAGAGGATTVTTSGMGGDGGSGTGGDVIPPNCGDGTVDPGEQCDDAGESATCDDDCSTAECGDGRLNVTAGESCDDGAVVPGDGCDGACAPEGTCEAPLDIALSGDATALTLTGSVQAATGGVSQVEAGSCDGVAMVGEGSDRVHAVTLTDARSLTVTLTGGFQKALRVLGAPCDLAQELVEPGQGGGGGAGGMGGAGDGCVATDTASPNDAVTLEYPNLAAGTYYIVVDTFDDAAHGYDLTFEASRPARSCRELRDNGEAVDGVYTLDADGPGGRPPFDAFCDMTTDGGGFTLALVQDVTVNWSCLTPAVPPTNPTVATNSVLHHEDFAAMNVDEMYVRESGQGRILKFYYPRNGVDFVSNYRNFTERNCFNSAHFQPDAPHTGIGRDNQPAPNDGHTNAACTTANYAGWKARNDCRPDATNSYPAWGDDPGGGQNYTGGSDCWFFGGTSMTAVPSITTCPVSSRAPFGFYSPGTLSGVIQLWVR